MKIIYWLPRVLSIGFVLYLSVFALDVFDEASGWELILGLLIHLLPSLILLALIIIAWKKDFFGAILFLVIAVGYVLLVGFDRSWSWYVGISCPALLVAILYFISWRKNKSHG